MSLNPDERSRRRYAKGSEAYHGPPGLDSTADKYYDKVKYDTASVQVITSSFLAAGVHPEAPSVTTTPS